MAVLLDSKELTRKNTDTHTRVSNLKAVALSSAEDREVFGGESPLYEKSTGAIKRRERSMDFVLLRLHSPCPADFYNTRPIGNLCAGERSRATL